MYARHEAALADLTQAALANTDLPTLMRQAAMLAAQTLAVAYSAIWELLPSRSALVLRAAVGWQEDGAERASSTVAPTSPIGASVLGNTPTIVADWPTETRFERPTALRDQGVISSVAVAIPGPAQPFGSLSVDVTASRMFSDEEIDFLRSVANVLALAIDRFQSDQAITQQVDERTRAFEQQLVAAAHDTAVLEERQRLARDLHDSVTQSLYSVTLHAQGARRLLAAGELGLAADALRGLQETAQEALDEMRLLLFELRPPILEQVGLIAALQARLNAVEGRANLQTKLIADEVDNLPPAVEQALYRIAQEALNNALKHARAQRIVIQIQQAPGCVVLDISDDGVGFEPAAANTAGGLGLRGIAERVAQLGGRVDVQSAPGKGTQLRVEAKL